MDFGTVCLNALLIICGSWCIGSCIRDFKQGYYVSFGFGLILAIICLTNIIKTIIL